MIGRLNKSDYENFKLETLSIINDEQAILLVGKHIHFTWHDRSSNIVCTIPGKVLEYLDNKLRIYTNDIVMIDDSDNENNMIYDIELNDISNVYVFDEYNQNFEELFDCINEETIGNDVYTITNIYDNKMEVIITDYDSLSINFIYKESGEKVQGEYPVYLLRDIERKGDVSMNKSYLLTIVGRPGTGKTTLMIETIKKELDEGKKILFYSLEIGKELVEPKFNNISNLTIKDEVIKDMKLIVENIEDIKPDVVYIDYLELLPANAIDKLKEISRECNLKIVVNSQLSMKYMNITSDDEFMNMLKEEHIYKVSDKCIIA